MREDGLAREHRAAMHGVSQLQPTFVVQLVVIGELIWVGHTCC